MTLFSPALYENSCRTSFDTCFCAQVSGLLPHPPVGKANSNIAGAPDPDITPDFGRYRFRVDVRNVGRTSITCQTARDHGD